MQKLPYIFSLIIMSAMLLNGCETENCPPNAMAYAKFSMVSQDGTPVTHTVPTSIIGQIVVEDSVINDTIINKDAKLSTFKVPLSYSDKTTFIIDYDGGQKDVIEVTHRNIPYFTNIDCGTMMFYEVTGVTHSNGIDSIVIVNPNIDNYEKENFKIYFTVADTQ